MAERRSFFNWLRELFRRDSRRSIQPAARAVPAEPAPPLRPSPSDSREQALAYLARVRAKLFEAVRAGFYRGSRAAALVYDVTIPASLVNLRRWQDKVLLGVPGQPLLVVGNKIDMERAVRTQVGQASSTYIGAPHLETSALTGHGVAALFGTLAKLAMDP